MYCTVFLYRLSLRSTDVSTLLLLLTYFYCTLFHKDQRMIINLAVPNTDTGSPLTVGATESPAAVAMTESPVDVGVTGSPAAVTVEVDSVPTTERPMVVGA
jgi:hypothetical protein